MQEIIHVIVHSRKELKMKNDIDLIILGMVFLLGFVIGVLINEFTWRPSELQIELMKKNKAGYVLDKDDRLVFKLHDE